MAYEEGLRCITVPANADLSSSQYSFVKLTNASGKGRAALTGNGESALGVLQNKPSAAGDASTVGVRGVSKLKLGGAVTAGDPVSSDASGLGVSAATGDIVLGEALESGVSGDLIPVNLDKRNAVANGITT